MRISKPVSGVVARWVADWQHGPLQPESLASLERRIELLIRAVLRDYLRSEAAADAWLATPTPTAGRP